MRVVCMPRAGWRKPESDRRLSDLVSVGVLTRVFPPALVDEVIAASGRTQVRHRALPARVMAYFAIGMGLCSDGSYEDALSQLTDGLAWASGWREHYRLPGKSAIFQARERLGAQPLADLFARVARPLGGPDTPGTWMAGRRLVAIDGTCLDVADTLVNENFFGRPGVDKGEKSAFPQARLLAVAECGSHAIFAAAIGAYREAESDCRASARQSDSGDAAAGRPWILPIRPVAQRFLCWSRPALASEHRPQWADADAC